ncbi:unnamed protein product [Prorocentrum cordatum]|uniref:Amino acid transporter n=1 Tax=Prorocentrum cordatum TaxID=2364126 RepID=A0ABN9STW6_9DINO|nr:unnamed protein product [Polarella glacialis]
MQLPMPRLVLDRPPSPPLRFPRRFWSERGPGELWGAAASVPSCSASRGLFADCALVAFCNSAFSLFGGLVVFSVVGNLAATQGKAVEEVAASGEGLAFIVFAQGLGQMGSGVAPSVLSALFFLTLFLLGLDSSFAVVETLQTYLNDWMMSRNPGVKLSVRGNALRLVLLCTALLLIGLPYVTREGYLLLEVPKGGRAELPTPLREEPEMRGQERVGGTEREETRAEGRIALGDPEVADHWVTTYCLTIGVLLEYIMLGYVYTAEQVLQDVEASTGVALPRFFTHQIRYVAPALLTLVVGLLVLSEASSDSMSGYPTSTVCLFGIFPILFALSTALWPAVQFRLRRLLRGSALTPEGLEAARQRARGPGFQTFREEDMIESTPTGSAPLALNRA